MIMSALYIPPYIRKGINPNDRGGRMDRIIYGGDTETVEGEPNSMQFYSEDIPCNDFYIVNKHNALTTFLKWCSKRSSRSEHVIYVHNLKFDLVEFLYGVHEKLAQTAGEFNFKVGGWHLSGVYGVPTFCRLSDNTKHKRTILLIDSYSFFRGSLAEAAKLYCPDLPKLRRPKDLGKHRYRRTDANFVAYAMRDPEITYHIGKAIEALHHEFDLKQCVSVADLAARVFRHRFLNYTIPQPTDDIICASLDSYHGGKNNITVAPGWYLNTTGLDISSAYPHAMRDMPSFAYANLYKRYKPARKVVCVPEYGVYQVTGTVATCRWPVLFAHDFTPLSGKFSDVSIQGFELNEALRSGELKVSRIHGWYYAAERDNQASAFRKFVDDFYKRKQSEKNPVRRYGYKTILNSVYGKFIQTRKRSQKAYVSIDSGGDDSGKVSETSELVAGGMFHPFIASAITAHTRARIHRIEHKHRAIHTATDGVFTVRRVGKMRDTGLGSLNVDAKGDLLLVRNKLYIMYAKEGAVESRAFQGKRILKWALHGFQGSVFDLERLIATNRRKYVAKHVNQLKESMNRGLQVNRFVERDATLKVGPLRVQT
jgi:DNA polymerase type B, organellar and viral